MPGLVAYGVRADGSRHLWAFQRSPGESQAAGEGLLGDLDRRGWEGQKRPLIPMPHRDGWAGLAAALQTVYPRGKHPRCWVHQRRNILERVRKRDYDAVQAGAQALYLARDRGQAQNAFERFRRQWQSVYPAMVRRLERDLPERFTFYDFPRHLWRKLRTTHAIERGFVEVRRRTRPMVCFLNVQSVDRILYALFQQYSPQWKNRTLQLFTQAA